MKASLLGSTEEPNGVVCWLTEKLSLGSGTLLTLFAGGDSATNARLVPACKQALRLDADFVEPMAHHALMVEKVFDRADNFDLIHFHIDYLIFR